MIDKIRGCSSLTFNYYGRQLVYPPTSKDLWVLKIPIESWGPWKFQWPRLAASPLPYLMTQWPPTASQCCVTPPDWITRWLLTAHPQKKSATSLFLLLILFFCFRSPLDFAVGQHWKDDVTDVDFPSGESPLLLEILIYLIFFFQITPGCTVNYRNLGSWILSLG